MVATTQIQSNEVIKAIDEIIKCINLGETIVFFGAGISRNSGLPVVNQIVPYVLEKLDVPKEDTQLILDKDNNPKIPFEAFMECLRENSKVDKIYDIYACGEPNTNHILLAKLAKEGKLKTIITTNFDMLIEHALAQEPNGWKEGEKYDVIYKEKDFENINWSQDKVRLIKIHGSIHNKEEMAITLAQVARKESSKAREKIIEEVFSKGKHKSVLILGYSCSDVFDLSPQIEAINGKLKEMLFVQHSDNQDIEDIRKQEDKNPFKEFKNSKRLYLDTNKLVEVLWRLIIKETYNFKKSHTKWKEKVDEWYSESIQKFSGAIKYYIPGILFYNTAEWSTTIRYYEHGLIISKKNNFKQAEGIIYGGLGSVYWSLGEYQKAIEYHEQALKVSRDIGDKQGEGIQLGSLGNAYWGLGEYQKAIEYLEQALKVSRDIGDKKDEGALLGNLGSVYTIIGDYQKAIEYHEQALKMSRDIGEKRGEGIEFGNLGGIYNYLGDYQKAIEYHKQALKIAKDIGDKKGEGNRLGNLGNSYFSLGDYQKAIRYYEQALKMAKDIGDKRNEGNWLGNLGNSAFSLSEYQKAIEYYKQALKISRDIGNKQVEGIVLSNLGNAYSSLGEYQKAIEYYNQSLDVFRTILPSNNAYIKTTVNNLRIAKSKIRTSSKFLASLLKRNNNYKG